MEYEALLVVSFCLLFAIARSNETLTIWQGVRGPLLSGRGDECAAKENCVFVPVGEHWHFSRGGRATSAKSSRTWDFDSTRGYPGEDIQ